jgi:hypothetical protein
MVPFRMSSGLFAVAVRLDRTTWYSQYSSSIPGLATGALR